MKKWLIVIFIWLLSFGIASADTTTTRITLLWNSNTESDLGGYGVYSSLDPGPPYDLISDGVEPSQTNTVSFTSDTMLVNINEPTYFAVDAFDVDGNRSGFSEPCVYTHCVPYPEETKTVSCPAGQTGSIVQKRTSSCTFNSMPVWTAWIQTSNTCKVVSTCAPTTQTRTIRCDKWLYKGSTIQQRTSICNVDGTISWGPWITVSSTCRPWYRK